MQVQYLFFAISLTILGELCILYHIQNTERMFILRKILCLCLSFVLLISFAGCNSNNKDTSTNNNDNNGKVDGIIYYDSPQYNSKVLDANYLKQHDYLKVWEEENSHLKENFEALQGKVLDLYYSSETTYALTEDAIYCIDNFARYINKLNIDVERNSEIVAANARSKNEHKYIVLKNKDNVYSVYIADKNDIQTFYKCQINQFNPKENEQIVLYNGEGFSAINLVSFSGNNICVRSYTIVNPEDATSVIYKDQKFTLSQNTSKLDIVQYVPDTFVNGNEGIFVLSNGEAHVVAENWEGNDVAVDTINKIENVIHIIGKDLYYIYMYSNFADLSHIVCYTSIDVEDNEIYPLFGENSNGVEYNNIIFNVDKHFIGTSSNKALCYYDIALTEPEVSKMTEIENLLNEYLQNGKLVDIAVYQNTTLILMDDHYLYSLVS